MKCPIFFFLMAGLAVSLAAEQTLDQQLAVDNPKVITYLKSLSDSQKVRPLSGVRISGGEVELSQATYLDSRHLLSKKQHIYLFRVDGDYRAYVWVDAGGAELSIPPDKKGSPGENAYLLSGDIYTFGEVGPGDGLVILSGASPAWLEQQTDSPVKPVWKMTKASSSAPKGSLLLELNGKSYPIIKKAAAPYQELLRKEFKDYGLPKEALLAAYSWHAGFGDVVYILRKGDLLEVYQQEMDESETSHYPLKRLLKIPLN